MDWKSPWFIATLLVVLWLGSPDSLTAQEERESAGARRTAVLAGLGNSVGWFGAQVEQYFYDTRLSGFAGIGFIPDDGGGEPTFAGGLRAYTPGENHRAFLELSVSTVLRESRTLITPDVRFSEDSSLYGPGLQAGYAYTADSGFTAMVSVGAGYALGMAAGNDGNPVAMLFGLGLGYTWR